MTDEQKWLLIFGRGWVALEVVEEHDPIFSRLAKDKKLDVDQSFECVRLKPQNEPIRVHVAPTPGVHTI